MFNFNYMHKLVSYTNEKLPLSSNEKLEKKDWKILKQIMTIIRYKY